MSTSQLERYLEEVQSNDQLCRQASTTHDLESHWPEYHKPPTQRYFLEPACDGCVVREQEELMACNGDSLVWGSEVNVVIDPRAELKPYRPSKPKTTTTTKSRSSCRAVIQPALPLSPIERVRPVPSPRSGHDADDEGTRYITEARPSPGRFRTESKQIRRRGIDLTRDELRISSKWANEEKIRLEQFRNIIKTKMSCVNEGNDTGRISRKPKQFIADAMSIGHKITDNLRRGVGRSKSPQKRCSVPQNEPLPGEVFCEDPPSGHMAQLDSARIESGASLSASIDLPGTEISCESNHSEHVLDTRLSWQNHLRSDLSDAVQLEPRRRKHKYLLREGPASHERSGYQILPSQIAFQQSSARISRSQSCSRLPSTRTFSILSERDVDPGRYWRLPSLASSRSYQPSTSSITRLERLDKILGSSDFETDESDQEYLVSTSSRSDIVGFIEHEMTLKGQNFGDEERRPILSTSRTEISLLTDHSSTTGSRKSCHLSSSISMPTDIIEETGTQVKL